jgi:hypothetical protein
MVLVIHRSRRRPPALGLPASGQKVRKYVAAGLDETGQEEQGTGLAGVKRQSMGCIGRVQDPGAGRYRPRST